METTQECNELISSLLRLGVRLWVEDGKLRFQAPKGVLLPETREELRRRRREVIRLLEKTDGLEDSPLTPRAPGSVIPLTAMQRRRWLRRHEERRYRLRTGIIAIRVTGPLHAAHLQASLDALVRRHEPLRTRIVEAAGIPCQQIDPASSYCLELIDLTKVTPEDADQTLRLLAEEFVSEEVDFSTGSLFATKLFKLSNIDHVLVITLNHMISDGVSNEILHKEIWSSYELYRRGQKPSIIPLPLQFADYAVWQKRNHNAWMRQHASYWRSHLAGAQPGYLKRDFEETPEKPCAAYFELEFGSEISTKLRQLAQHEKCLLSIVVFAAYTAVMSKWCEKQDLVVRLIIDTRYRPELESMIGFIASHLYLRVQKTPEDTFISYLRRLLHEFYSAYDHLDFDRVPDLLPGHAATEIHFNWVPGSGIFSPDYCETLGALVLRRYPIPNARVLNFTAFFSDNATAIAATVAYRKDRFSSATLSRFGNALRHFAQTCVESPDVGLELALTRSYDILSG